MSSKPYSPTPLPTYQPTYLKNIPTNSRILFFSYRLLSWYCLLTTQQSANHQLHAVHGRRWLLVIHVVQITGHSYSQCLPILLLLTIIEATLLKKFLLNHPILLFITGHSYYYYWSHKPKIQISRILIIIRPVGLYELFIRNPSSRRHFWVCPNMA